MKLEDQVCSLEHAKRLKELDVKQESLFYFDWHSDVCYSVKFLPYSCRGIERYSAFTVGELGNMLPSWVEAHNLIISKSETWFLRYRSPSSFIPGNTEVIEEENEATARAKMLIYLIENKLVEISK